MSDSLQGDALGNPYVTDPIYKAGQDPGGEIADGLSARGVVGPLLDLIGSTGSPFTVPNTGSEEAIYSDTLEVTDADLLGVEIALFWQATGGAQTTLANASLGLQKSGDGLNWFTIPVINRAALIAPATMFRNDPGTAAVGVLDPTGGFASAANTQNAPLPEDLTPLLVASLTAAADTPFVVQRGAVFNVAAHHYVRLVVVPIFTEPPDFLVPLLLVRCNKAVSP